MKGIRIVRIVTNSQAHRMGYGSRALQLLYKFYEKSTKIENIHQSYPEEIVESKKEVKSKISEEELKPKKKLKPLLEKLEDCFPPFIYWIGASFGLNSELFNFWSKNEMFPVYLKLTENDITGEHTCIMLKPFKNEEINFKRILTFEGKFIINLPKLRA